MSAPPPEAGRTKTPIRCPDEELLVAYVDGTLHPRDADAVQRHVGTCGRCAALLASIHTSTLDTQQLPHSQRFWSPTQRWGLAALSLAVVGMSLWFIVPRSKETADAPVATEPVQPSPPSAREPSETRPVQPSAPPEARPEKPPASEAVAIPPTSPTGSTKAAPETTPHVAARPVREPPPTVQEANTSSTAAPDVRVAAPSTLDNDGVGETFRVRSANRQIAWRVRDRVIEHSTDRGSTWTSEYTADRALLAGAYVAPNVAWMVGANGLVLRRTSAGWFEANAPAADDIVAVTGASPSKASVTLSDGRGFRTENGGVTWSER